MILTNKAKTIAEQAIYGDLMGIHRSVPLDLKPITYATRDTVYMDNELYPIKDILPVLYPLSYIVDEIAIPHYNNGILFFPLMEIAKDLYEHLGYTNFKTMDYGTIYAVECESEDFVLTISVTNNVKLFIVAYYQRKDNIDSRPFEEVVPMHTIFDKLHRWHIDTRDLIDTGDAISMENYFKLGFPSIY